MSQYKRLHHMMNTYLCSPTHTFSHHLKHIVIKNDQIYCDNMLLAEKSSDILFINSRMYLSPLFRHLQQQILRVGIKLLRSRDWIGHIIFEKNLGNVIRPSVLELGIENSNSIIKLILNKNISVIEIRRETSDQQQKQYIRLMTKRIRGEDL